MVHRSQNLPVSDCRRGLRGFWLWGLALAIASAAGLWLDLPIARWESTHRLPGDLLRSIRLTEIFAHGFGVAVLATGIWMLAPHLRRFVPRLVGCALLPAGAAALFKWFVFRKRPAAYLSSENAKVYPDQISDSFDVAGSFPAETSLTNIHWNSEYMFQSFPSAHAATVAGLAMGMAWLFPRGRKLFVLIAILASIQRVTASAHWTSDVLAGAALGVMLGGAMTCHWGLGYVLGKFEQRSKNVISGSAKNNPQESKLAA